MSAEHRAILLLLALAAGGQGVRFLLSRPGEAPGSVRILPDSRTGSPLAHRDSAVHLARPLAPGERLDLDRASAAELARLPGVGPALGRALVAYRELHGPFGQLSAVDSVPGVGAVMLQKLGEHARFSGSPRTAPGHPLGAPQATLTPSQRLDLNRATAAEFDRLPGIGPSKAQAIVAYRDAHGPFGSVADLGRVPGIGRSIVARLQDLAVVR